MNKLELLIGLMFGLYIGVFIGVKIKKWIGPSPSEQIKEEINFDIGSRSNTYVELTVLINNKCRPWDKVKIRRDSIVLIDMYNETLKANINGETIEFKLEHECFRRLYYGN